jgi:ribosomal protein L11 methyltransferase
LIIQPSTGFGTGHHATTRLCLQGLQTLDLRGLSILDVGAGSGVLALAARKLGAHRALGVDVDPDAVRAAIDNLPLNAEIDNVAFQVSDFTTSSPAPADVVTANLTGALLCRASADLMKVLPPDGVLIVSGLQAHERDEVVQAFRALNVEWECEEEGWVGLLFRRPA